MERSNGRMVVRGVRGAISVAANTKEAIHEATIELLEGLCRANHLVEEDVVSVFFTVTPDLNADFPAYAARKMGWKYVPLLCATEIAVPGAMGMIVRVLMHVNTTKGQREIVHLYLGDAVKLRPDLRDPG